MEKCSSQTQCKEQQDNENFISLHIALLSRHQRVSSHVFFFFIFFLMCVENEMRRSDLFIERSNDQQEAAA